MLRFWNWHWFGIPAYIQRKAAGKVGGQNTRLSSVVLKQQAIIGALNVALGEAEQRAQNEHHEKLVFLASLALQNGGTIVLPRTFVDTVLDGNYRVTIGPDDDNNLIIALKQPEEVET